MAPDLQRVVRDRIRLLAKQRGYSINRLAEFAGISGGYLSTVLRGQKSPTLRTIEKIADALEIDPFDLFKRA
jgi:transcriptional regulator with XRE-family HTH domain